MIKERKIKEFFLNIIIFGIFIMGYSFSFSILEGDNLEYLPVFFIILIFAFFLFPGFIAVFVFFDPDNSGTYIKGSDEEKRRIKREEDKITSRPYLSYVGMILMMLTIFCGFYYYGEKHERIGYEKAISENTKTPQ